MGASIPAGGNSTLPATGQVYVVLSTADGASSTVSDENTISGVGVLEIGNSTSSSHSSDSGKSAYKTS